MGKPSTGPGGPAPVSYTHLRPRLRLGRRHLRPVLSAGGELRPGPGGGGNQAGLCAVSYTHLSAASIWGPSSYSPFWRSPAMWAPRPRVCAKGCASERHLGGLHLADAGPRAPLAGPRVFRWLAWTGFPQSLLKAGQHGTTMDCARRQGHRSGCVGCTLRIAGAAQPGRSW